MERCGKLLEPCIHELTLRIHSRGEVIVLVFDQDAELKQLGKVGASPELTAGSERALKLFAQRLHGTTAHRDPSLLHSAVVEVRGSNPPSRNIAP